MAWHNTIVLHTRGLYMLVLSIHLKCDAKESIERVLGQSIERINGQLKILCSWMDGYGWVDGFRTVHNSIFSIPGPLPQSLLNPPQKKKNGAEEHTNLYLVNFKNLGSQTLY